MRFCHSRVVDVCVLVVGARRRQPEVWLHRAQLIDGDQIVDRRCTRNLKSPRRAPARSRSWTGWGYARKTTRSCRSMSRNTRPERAHVRAAATTRTGNQPRAGKSSAAIKVVPGGHKPRIASSPAERATTLECACVSTSLRPAVDSRPHDVSKTATGIGGLCAKLLEPRSHPGAEVRARPVRRSGRTSRRPKSRIPLRPGSCQGNRARARAAWARRPGSRCPSFARRSMRTRISLIPPSRSDSQRSCESCGLSGAGSALGWPGSTRSGTLQIREGPEGCSRSAPARRGNAGAR